MTKVYCNEKVKIMKYTNCLISWSLLYIYVVGVTSLTANGTTCSKKNLKFLFRLELLLLREIEKNTLNDNHLHNIT